MVTLRWASSARATLAAKGARARTARDRARRNDMGVSKVMGSAGVRPRPESVTARLAGEVHRRATAGVEAAGQAPVRLEEVGGPRVAERVERGEKAPAHFDLAGEAGRL